jgi:chromosome segregation protein
VVVNGFKSFYSRTEIDFESGIIGIVGPNGCGKSNIYDAVQWVLGEQSAKQLRSDEISDVIARGNVRRAEKNEAEAYLTFNECQDVLDTDRDQIEVGRKVNHDGEGTYFLNGEEVRLKDVQDLFRDTGIGQDLYSSIGQGEVLKLIDSKPEERREIIEEAAGIASYRHRRDLTQRRLKQTRDELQQVEKDLNEKQGRLSQLRGQAQKADTVRELQSELREKRLELARRDFKSVQERIQSLEEKLDSTESELEEARQAKQSVEERKENRLRDQRSIKSKIASLEAFASPVRERRQTLREKLSELKTRVKSLRDQQQREEKNISQLHRQFQSELNGLARAEEDGWRASLRRRISQQQLEVLNEKDAQLVETKRTLESRRRELRERNLFQQNEVKDIKRRLDDEKSKLADNRSDVSQLEDELSQSIEETRELHGERTSNRRSFLRSQVEVNRFELQKMIKNKEQSVLHDLQEQNENRRNSLRNRTDRLKNRMDSLSERLESNEGIPQGAKHLLNGDAGQRFNSVAGLLVDHIEVDEEYRTSIEAVLGDRLHDVLVEGTDSLRDLWDFITKAEKGPVRLRDMVPETNGDGSQKESGSEHSGPGIGPALNFVSCTEHASGVVRELLEDVCLVEDIAPLVDEGKEELTNSGSFTTYVDTDGSVYETSGTLSFDESARRNGGGVLQRKQELSRVKDDLGEAEDILERFDASLKRVKTLKDRCDRQLEQIQGGLQGLRGEVRGARESLRESRHEFQRNREMIESRRESLVDRRRSLLETRYRARAMKTIKETLDRTENHESEESKRLEKTIERVDDALSTTRKKERSSEQARSVAESRIQDSESRCEESKDRLGYLHQNVRETREHVRELRQNRLDTRKELARHRLQLRYHEDQIKTFDALSRELDDRQSEVTEELETVNDALREHEKEIEQIRGTRKKVESELSNERARKQELQEKIQDELEISPAKKILETNFDDQENYDHDELSERVRSIKSEIRDLQPVNMLAGEEADELEDEVAEVQSQYEDLQSSCDKLESLIDRLNTKARKQFLEAFSEIQSYFEEFVAELFQGGNGSIELTDDPVLEAGVEIQIEPPGEQLRTMSALSGGEKTLGALAFLFALYERKSTPFCFLDEVDHPLDDENVNQFVQLLSRYRERTQFIIITHNKLTMQATDKLFGVTMEESGVTSVVPMDLDEAESLRESGEDVQEVT